MYKWILAGILLLSFLFRTVDLPHHPAGFTPDEASFGYDAYSLLKTGKDQWGNPWPIVFKSFGDYKMPLYTYLALPSVAVFGLNEFATRLPNGIVGTLAVLVTYFLVKEMFKKDSLHTDTFALFAALLLALSPWHIPLSRGAFEANLTSFLLPAGVLFFLKGIKSPRFLVFSAIFFGLNLFSYHSARLVTPIVGIALLWEYRRHIKSLTKSSFGWIAGAICLLFAAAVLGSFLQGANTRLASSSIFTLATRAPEERFGLVRGGLPPGLGYVFFNKYTFIVEKFFAHYVSYISPQYLFTEGPGEGTYGMLPGVGTFYVFEAIFIVSFIIWYAKRKDRPVWVFVWLLVGPIPAALSVGVGGAANRAAVLIPVAQIASAIGAVYLIQNIRVRWRKSALILLSASFSLCVLSFFVHYWYIQPLHEGKSMLYGMKDLYSRVADATDMENIIISRKISEPHMYAAFYWKIDPIEYQKWSKQWDLAKANVSWVDQQPVYKLKNITFKTVDWVIDLEKEKTLIIGLPGEFPEKTVPFFVVPLPNDERTYIGVLSHR